jgi:hypothetical protein
MKIKLRIFCDLRVVFVKNRILTLVLLPYCSVESLCTDCMRAFLWVNVPKFRPKNLGFDLVVLLR